jgi:hypothetical protein
MIQQVVIIDTGELWLGELALHRWPSGSQHTGKIR